MRLARIVKAKKVSIIRDDNAIVVQGEVQVIDVVGAEETSAGGGGHVDPATTKPVGDGRVNMFVKVKPDGPRHPVSTFS